MPCLRCHSTTGIAMRRETRCPDGNGGVVCDNDTAAAIAQQGNRYPDCVPIDAFVDGQVHRFSGVYRNSLPTAPLIPAQPRVPSFTTVDLTLGKNMTFDDGFVAQLYFSVRIIVRQSIRPATWKHHATQHPNARRHRRYGGAPL